MSESPLNNSSLQETDSIILKQNPENERDLIWGRMIGAVVMLSSGFCILLLGRTTVSFVLGAFCLFAGLGFMAAIRKLQNNRVHKKILTLELTHHSLFIQNDGQNTTIAWTDMQEIDIDDTCSLIHIKTEKETFFIEPGIGKLSLEQLLAQLQSYWHRHIA